MLIEDGRHAGLVPAIHRLRDEKDQKHSGRDPRIKSAGFARSACFGLLHRSVLRRPGGYSEEPLPDPIPNSAVKVLCADGTKSQGLEE
jgi:hypothetical protein